MHFLYSWRHFFIRLPTVSYVYSLYVLVKKWGNKHLNWNVEAEGWVGGSSMTIRVGLFRENLSEAFPVARNTINYHYDNILYSAANARCAMKKKLSKKAPKIPIYS